MVEVGESVFIGCWLVFWLGCWISGWCCSVWLVFLVVGWCVWFGW